MTFEPHAVIPNGVRGLTIGALITLRKLSDFSSLREVLLPRLRDQDDAT